MLAQIKTKSNYKGLNYSFLPVKEIVGNRVTCLYFDIDFQRDITIDFLLSEILQFKN